MELPLIVGVDGSESSLRAVDWAVDEADRLRLTVRLVHASLWEYYEGAGLPFTPATTSPHGIGDQAGHIVAAAVDRAGRRNPEVKVDTEVLAEDTEAALLRAARNATALVTGSRGRGPLAGLLLGSVSLALASRAPCPVIVVRGSEIAGNAEHGRILLGVGDATTGSAAIRFAFREAAARRCTLDAVRAWRCPAHATADHPLLTGTQARQHKEHASVLLDDALRIPVCDHPEVAVRRAVVEGHAHKVLTDRSAAADLLILGARRRHGHIGLQLGRVAHTLLHHADCPVAVVPQRG
ncbi:universal stress protein [Streptomyces flavofungini]|uniref:Universal stress protein n=1 Tax=Streptomyces flavofungini TaxID=68200 RepID=A0ABS0XFB2_9ACTN|nr:universal stress protein [Streptomyces flavofungini]MBJ3811898.1 universal stress protein [Streptomyces flavofungini]GHC52614.1 universal stress protein [Streptomyces flavofungini]